MTCPVPKIPGITAFEDGVNNSPEGKNLGFTHVYPMTFESIAARDACLPHPGHRTFGELGVVDDVFVVDSVPSQKQAARPRPGRLAGGPLMAADPRSRPARRRARKKHRAQLC